MTTRQFEESVNAEIKRMMENKAVQVCSAGEWPEDMGGNWTPDRIEANIAFSTWLDQQGDSLVPSSFSEWLGSEDSILIKRDENPNNDT